MQISKLLETGREMKSIFLIAILFVTGCASVNTIEQDFASIDYSDGISKVEAKRIAQKFALGKKGSEKYAISAAEVDSGIFASFPEWKDKAWVIGFPSKSLNILSGYVGRTFVVAVDKNTGNIRFYYNGYAPGNVPVDMDSYGDEGILVKYFIILYLLQFLSRMLFKTKI